MVTKRAHEGDAPRPSADKKAKKHGDKKSGEKKHGFRVGPANLPDGTYKRKVDQIKKDLISKAKLKKEYAKIKEREEVSTQQSVYERAEERAAEEPAGNPALELHPDRLKRLEEPEPEPIPLYAPPAARKERVKRPRPQTYKNETEVANKRKAEAEARQKAREEQDKEREVKLAERERFRRAMAKARGGRDGKRKLGRESTVLLEKVKRMTGHA